jgi:methylenetetrahydrofolate reductase (NADPH)
MLAHDEKLWLLRINSFTGGAPRELLETMAAHARERSFARGEFIFAKGDPPGEFYILVEGRIGHPEVQRADEAYPVARGISAAGQIFGFAAAVAGSPRRVVSARCETWTNVLAINGEWFQRTCAHQGEAGQALLRRLTQVHAGYERSVLGKRGWLSIRNAGKTRDSPHGPISLIDNASMEARPHEICAVVTVEGDAGSTLAKLIAGLEPLADGAIYVDGELTNSAGGRTAQAPGRSRVVLQRGLHPRRTIASSLVRALRPRMPAKMAEGEARERLERSGLSAIAELQAQRASPALRAHAALLVAFCAEAPVVVLDDPFADLPAPAQWDACDALLGLHAMWPKTVVLTTRNATQALYVAGRVAFLRGQPARIDGGFAVDFPAPRSFALRATAAFTSQAEQAQAMAEGRIPAAVAAPPAITIESRRVVEALAAPPRVALCPAREPGASASNALREALQDGRFFWSVEFIPSVDKVLRDELGKLGGVGELIRREPLVAGFSVTDRVVSDRDPDPVAAAAHLADASGKQPLVHFSGKDRDIDDLHDFVDRMRQNGLQNILCLSGDRLKQEPADRRPRYLESVAAIQAARRVAPDLLIATALNPFKYREEDSMAQYLKLGKKVGAGADFAITQIGFDMRKYEEALFWVNTRGYGVPLVANVMPMNARRARYIRHHQLPGVTVTDSFLALLEAEERALPERGDERVLRRLALQILGIRFYGYAGVQLTGIHAPERLAALQAKVDALNELCRDRISWNKAWNESLTLPEGGRCDTAPARPWYIADSHTSGPAHAQMLKYRVMDGVHAFAFDRGPGARLLAPMLRSVPRAGAIDRLLERVERGIKGPLFGCETCGMCRLAATQYVCPETCPKGLANGPCGGTTDNLCEYRHQECIHSVKYRIAKQAGALDQLERWLIPPVPRQIRHTSSWPPHFRGEGPEIEVVDRNPFPGDEGQERGNTLGRS